MPFIPGLELSRRFYDELVHPLLDEHYPNLPHAAALIGYGSEVLGFDTEMSTDHAWAPRMQIFLRDSDEQLAEPIRAMLGEKLPRTFLGYPLNTVGVNAGIFFMQEAEAGPVAHRVNPLTLSRFIDENLGWKIARPLTVADWLTISSQLLGVITAGAVHFDNVGELTALREQLSWYPRDVWLYLLAAGWQRIGQEQHLMPRAGFVGDEPGSALIGSRLVRDVMSLCFLMERRYAPYPKWFGSAFQRLACAPLLGPILWRAQMAETWQVREAALVEAYEKLAAMHNALGLTDPLPAATGPFHDRPFRVIDAESFAAALIQQVRDPQVQRIAAKGLIGSIDQWSDNTDLRSHVHWRASLCKLYEDGVESTKVIE